MSKSVIRKKQFSGVNSPQTPHDDSHISFSLWWEHWQQEATTTHFPVTSIRLSGDIPKSTEATGRRTRCGARHHGHVLR